MKRSLIGLLLIGALMIVPGCYPDWPEHAGNAEVHGEVTLDGKPVHNAKVVFIPLQLKSSTGRLMPLAFGITNAEGEFELQYSDKSKEMIAGTYNVVISKIKSADGTDGNATSAGQGSAAWPEEFFPRGFSSTPMHGFKEEIPSNYNRQSTLNYTIEASPGIIRPKFELSSVDPLL
ncbi:MAG: hypothetical protein AB8B55_16245 [Mariniblastus sp.]